MDADDAGADRNRKLCISAHLQRCRASPLQLLASRGQRAGFRLQHHHARGCGSPWWVLHAAARRRSTGRQRSRHPRGVQAGDDPHRLVIALHFVAIAAVRVVVHAHCQRYQLINSTFTAAHLKAMRELLRIVLGVSHHRRCSMEGATGSLGTWPQPTMYMPHPKIWLTQNPIANRPRYSPII